MIAALRETISNLDVSKGTRRQLDDRLRDAAKAVGKGHTPDACKELDHFIKDVDHSGKKIGPADAANLIPKASDIQVALGC